jgi:DNA-binding NtrC family response regulator
VVRTTLGGRRILYHLSALWTTGSGSWRLSGVVPGQRHWNHKRELREVFNVRTVLLVDDCSEVRSGLTQRFEANGFRVLQASSGEEAREHFRQPVDVACFEYGCDGIRLLGELRSCSQCPSVIMTAPASREKAVEAICKGAHCFVEKTADLAAVVAAVESACAELGTLTSTN